MTIVKFWLHPSICHYLYHHYICLSVYRSLTICWYHSFSIHIHQSTHVSGIHPSRSSIIIIIIITILLSPSTYILPVFFCPFFARLCFFLFCKGRVDDDDCLILKDNSMSLGLLFLCGFVWLWAAVTRTTTTTIL